MKDYYLLFTFQNALLQVESLQVSQNNLSDFA